MRELHGQATEVVAAPFERCLALLSAIDRYPVWYPEVVRDVEVLERGPSGQPRMVRAKLHVARGRLAKDFDLVMAIQLESHGTVMLTKVTSDPSPNEFDVTWRLRDGERTRIELDLRAKLAVSRFVPLGGIGDSLAEGFVAAATSAVAS